MTNPTRNYAIEWILRRAGLTATQASAIAAAVIAGADPVDAAGDVFGDVSGSLLGPLNVVGLLASAIDGPAEDQRPLRYNEATDTWLPSAIEELGTDETDTALVLRPDGAGGVSWEAEPGGTAWYNVRDYGAVGDGTTDDTTAAQAAEDAAHAAGGGVVYAPAGSYKLTGLVHYPENALLGDGPQATFFLAGANAINVVTVTGVAADSAYEADHGPQVSGIEFGANSHTGCIGLSLIGLDFQSVSQCIFRGFTGNGTTGGIGLHYYGSLQGVTYDCKFLSNTTGIRYEAVSIGYWGSSLPPARVRVDWCFFYLNASHAIDWSGGQAIYITDSEFDVNGTAGDATTSAIKVRMAGDSHGLGLVGRGLWLETNHGNAVVDLGGTAIGEHSLADCWLAYNDTTYSISLDGSSAAQTLVASHVRHDAIVSPTTVSTWRSAGGTTYLNARECDGSTSGTWTGVRTEPLLSGQLVSDMSQWLALRLPNLTTTQRDAIASPTGGMLIWNTTTSELNRYSGSAWASAGGSITGFGTPAVVLGSAAAAGSATTAVRTDATIVAFDATAPADIPGPGVASSAGSVAFAARRNHTHALPYHDEPLTDGASNFIFDGGDIVVVTGVPN